MTQCLVGNSDIGWKAKKVEEGRREKGEKEHGKAEWEKFGFFESNFFLPPFLSLLRSSVQCSYYVDVTKNEKRIFEHKKGGILVAAPGFHKELKHFRNYALWYNKT